MDLYLIRHGESTGNGRQSFMGWSDHPLTGRGRAQAAAAAARLAGLGPMPVLCSDLPRTRETAEIIAARWGGAIEADARWRETHCGDFEGRPWSAFSEDPALPARFDADPYGAVMPGGESAAMMAARVLEAFTAALARPDARLAIVTHDGPLRAVLAHCLGIPPTHLWRFYTDHGGLTQISYADHWLAVRCVNDTGHLGEDVR